MQQRSIVIPLGKGSHWRNNELRYCLRSFEKYLSNIGDVIIVGELPDWITNVTHIEAKDNPDENFKERNIYEKILIACGYHGVSDDFLFANDDHILLSPFDINAFPYFFKEDLWEYAKRNLGNESYHRTLANTISYLVPRGIEPRNFDTHVPIIYNKDKFLKLQQLNWDEIGGYAIKSMYCNLNGVGGVYNEDVKCGSMGQDKEWLQARIGDKKYFSLTHYVASDMREILRELFPNKSKYEND